jgi:hypothetical protein
MNSTLLDAAREYLAQGISVVPVDGKIPTKSWKVYQTRFANEDDILEWHGTFPTGIAAITGEISGICVVDLDDVSLLTKFEWPETVRARTGRGVHLYFQYPVGKRIQSKSAVLPSMDVKAEGGLITLPPSKHMATGKTYEWDIPFVRSKLAPLPTWIVEKLEYVPDRICRKSPEGLWRNLQRAYVDSKSWLTHADIERANQVPIEEFLEGRVSMKSSGRARLVGLCPFHEESTPSFTAFLDSNSYYCFGCDKGGDVVDLAVSLQNYKFQQAVRWLLSDAWKINI